MQGVGGVVSGGGGSITSGVSMSTVSKDDNLVLSSEDSSSCLEESELELGLGLSLGGGSCKAQQGPWGDQYARFLTAKEFPYVGSSSSASSASSSSSSSSLSRANVSSGTKRSADSVAAANGARYYDLWIIGYAFSFLCWRYFSNPYCLCLVYLLFP